ncbi:MAG: helix-turn-helix domain-containing protein [Clostridiales bacterium]|nr:helix-turn-helix domain-containing protein [Clostridiales bacterium]
MELRLAENIRRMRKERSLTQEALADALGVTVGAVYKWEADLSVPELAMLIRIAALFDTSVDTLIGYDIQNNSRQAVLDRLYSYLAQKNKDAIEEAERALGRYPNDYWVIMAAANIYSNFGLEEKDRDKNMIRRSIELFEKASQLVPHDADPKYGKLMLQGNIATLYYFLDEKDKALEMLKANNEAGIFDVTIATMTAMSGDTSDECFQRIVNSFWHTSSDTINTIFALLMFYKNRGEIARIKVLARWGIEYINSIRKTDDPCFLDKMTASYMMAEAYAYLKSGDPDEAERILREARERAEGFDQTPNYSTDIIKLFENKQEGILLDVLGKTADEALEKMLSIIGDKRFTSMWRNLNK